jgi:hypothetical protein
VPTFHTEILQARPGVTGIEVPPAVIDELGAGKRPAVVVQIGDFSYRSTVGVMGGVFMIPLSSDRRAASGLAADASVDVTLTLDDAPRTVEVPADLRDGLDADPVARSAYESLSYSRQRALVEPIDQAKTPETRQRRIEKALETLRG